MYSPLCFCLRFDVRMSFANCKWINLSPMDSCFAICVALAPHAFFHIGPWSARLHNARPPQANRHAVMLEGSLREHLRVQPLANWFHLTCSKAQAVHKYKSKYTKLRDPKQEQKIGISHSSYKVFVQQALIILWVATKWSEIVYPATKPIFWKSQTYKVGCKLNQPWPKLVW